MSSSLPVLSVLLAGALLAAGGCGPSCKRIADARAMYLQRPAATVAHGRLLVPLRLANRLLASAVAETPSRRIQLSGLGALASALGPIDVRARKVRLVPAAKGRLGLELEVDLSVSGERALTVALKTALTPRLDTRPDGRRELSFGLDAESIRRLRPTVTPGSALRLAKILYKRLPRMLRPMISEQKLAGLLSAAITRIGSDSYGWLRGPLARLGKHRIAFTLPDFPLAKAIPRSLARPLPHLAVDLYFELPVRQGLEAGKGALPLNAEQIQLRLSGSSVAEIGNWAMERGLLPSRYDKQMKPTKEGGVQPILDWTSGAKRPLKVHVFRGERPCAHLRIGSRASVQVVENRLRLRIEGRKAERIQGSALVKLGVFFDSLWSRNIARTWQRAASVSIERGRRRIVLSLARAKLTDRELALAFSIVVINAKAVLGKLD